MRAQPCLNDAESRLILDLLERERGELPSEIRRTHNVELRKELQQREKVIDDLLDRLRLALQA